MIGLGIGLRNSGAGYLGGSGPGPSDLSGLVVHLSADGSFETAEANHTPGTPYHMLSTQVITNLASGGPSMSFASAAASGRPYYHTATWSLDVGVDAQLPMPNGYPFIATNKPSDSTLTTCAEERINFSGATADQTDYSGISVMYLESTGVGRRIFENIGGGGSYGRLDISEDGYCGAWDSVASGTVCSGSANDTRGYWLVFTWSHTAAAGTSCAFNGVRQGTNSVIDNATRYNCYGPYIRYTNAWTDHILYEAGHTLADLDAVASALASKYGITYTTP